MKKNFAELVFLLDRSGSMAGLESDTIGGFNSMLEKQKKVHGEAAVTTVLFDDRYELIHDRIDIRGIEPMTDKQYWVRGSTALMDAMGKTIRRIAAVQKNTSEDYRADKVIFVIITDGLENASGEYSYKDIHNMVETERDRYGWEFIFLGANMDAVAEAAKYGIREDRAVTYSGRSVCVKECYVTIADFLKNTRSGCKVGSEWKADIEKMK